MSVGVCVAMASLKRTSEAEQLLRRLATEVEPIMSKRGWRVAKLEEFLPDNRGLLGMNVNRGAVILIRRACRVSHHAM